MSRNQARMAAKSERSIAAPVRPDPVVAGAELERTAVRDHQGAQRLPSVSICTLTRNRQRFLPLLQACVAAQTYPHALIEWVIVDDSDNGEPPFVEAPDLDVRVRHVRLPETLILGHKRNVSHQHCEGEIIVYMDDDDYYPPQRVRHAVDRLLETDRLVAGSTILPIYFTDTGQAWVACPYAANHATANTFAFRRELLETTRYEDAATHAEEKAFLKNYQIPMAQLDPAQTILCMGHSGNTFDKRKLIQAGKNPRMRKLADIPDGFVDADRLARYVQMHQSVGLPGADESRKLMTSSLPRGVQMSSPVVGAWYINLDQNRRRRIFVESQQKWLPDDVMLERVSALTPQKLAAIPEYSYLQLLNPLRQVQHCVVLSHLAAMHDFVENSHASHALILEDDVDLGCMQHWGFDINDVARCMKDEHGILQLNVIWSASVSGGSTRFLVPQIMSYHLRSSREYSTAAYLVRRETAAAILDFFRPKGRDFFHLLRYPDKDLIVADALLYDADRLGHGRPTSCLPIFYLGEEDLGLIIDRPGHAAMHRASREFMVDYLKKASLLPLDHLMVPPSP